MLAQLQPLAQRDPTGILGFLITQIPSIASLIPIISKVILFIAILQISDFNSTVVISCCGMPYWYNGNCIQY